MTTYNTGNPLGSTAVKDLYDNAQNLDIAVNSSELTWLDRGPSGIARTRKTYAGIEMDARLALEQTGYVYTVPLNYAAGIAITLPNQIFLQGGEYYKPGPTLTLPYTTTGVWATEQALFRSVGDATLRGQLAASGGVNLVNGALRQIATVAALRTSVGRYDGEVISLQGYSVLGQGGGQLYWSATSSETDDGGSTFQVTGVTTGRWKRFGSTLSFFDFGALGTGTGVTGVGADDTAALQAAFYWAQVKHTTLRVPALAQGFLFRVTATLLVLKGFNLIGDGVAVFDNPLSTTTINTRGPGSWIYFDHAARGIYFNDTISRRGAVIDGLAFMRNQPAPVVGGTFTPAANGFDIDIRDFDDIDIKNTMFLNPTKAINNFGGVRLLLDNVKGQPLQIGVAMDAVFDVCRFSKVHWWPFWTNIDSVEVYTSLNLSQYQFGRIDNCMVESCFGIFSRRMFNITSSVYGACNKLRISNCDSDGSASFVTISADAATLSISNCVQQNSGRSSVRTALGAGPAGIEWAGGNDGRLQFSNLSLQGSNASCIVMYNGINRIQGVNLEMGNWGQSISGALGVDIQGNSNIFELANPPRIINKVAGSGNFIGGAGVSIAEIDFPLSSGMTQGATTDSSGYLTVPIPDRGVPPRKFLATSQANVLHHVSLTSAGSNTVQVRVFDVAGAPLNAQSV